MIALLFAAPAAAILAGFALHKGGRRGSDVLALLSSVVVTAAAWTLLVRVWSSGPIEATLWRWIEAGSFSAGFEVRVDGLSASVLAMVSLVATLITAYSTGYMKGDPGYGRFFLYLHLFFLMMTGFLVSGNYLLMYLFWEGVGLASYLLVGFWTEKASARAAAWKAFLTNRVGDSGFLAALLLMWAFAGSVRFDDVFATESLPAAAVALCLFWAASAKSAQFPLYVWLPDAMEGPTPVSALMHAATMVAAGVFLMARSWPLLAAAPEARIVVACVGAATALGAGVLAATKRDLKKVLAYSTVSQLGLMMLALGTGSLLAAVFHLITHGFFKALLFLCAGNVIHGLGGGKTSATVDDVGGLGRAMPMTAGLFLIGALALGGFPPLAGFFSKDMILESVAQAGFPALTASFLLTAALSSFYAFRLFWLVFTGERRPRQSPPAHPHEAPAAMAGPVAVLAAACLAAGVLGPTGALARLLGQEQGHFSWGLAAAGLAAGLVGLGASWLASGVWDWEWRERRAGLARAFEADLGMQAAAHGAAGLWTRLSRALAVRWDAGVLDEGVETLADTCVGLGEGLSGLPRGLLNEYLWWIAAGTAAVAAGVLWL